MLNLNSQSRVNTLTSWIPIQKINLVNTDLNLIKTMDKWLLCSVQDVGKEPGSHFILSLSLVVQNKINEMFRINSINFRGRKYPSIPSSEPVIPLLNLIELC